MRRPASRRMDQVQSPMIPVVGEWIRQHPGTISLGQGIVHYSPPHEVGIAVSEAAKTDPRIHRYGHVRGIDELLFEIQRKVKGENEIDIEANDASIVVTTGSNMGFLNAVLSIADPGEELILLSPYYFNHEMAIDIAGCRPVIVPTNSNYQLDIAAMEAAISPKTRAIVTVSPNNPTGAVYSPDDLIAVNRLCQQRGIYHISDEAYEYFVYGDSTHFSPASLPGSDQHTISLYTLSKAYGMAGWRLGYMIIPSHLEMDIKKIQDTNLVCPPIINQLAGAAAMRIGAEWCRDQIASFGSVRDLVLDGLTELGHRCEVPGPDGGFYVLARLETSRTDLEIVEQLIRRFGIAVMPGSTFGVSQGCSIRIAYGALDSNSVAEGIRRIVPGLKTLLDETR